MTPNKEELFMNFLINALLRDDTHCREFMNMSYYLLRKYMLAFQKAPYDL
jgi:hypothetical protein